MSTQIVEDAVHELAQTCRHTMQALADELVRWRSASQQLNLREMEQSTAQQEKLFKELDFIVDQWKTFNAARPETASSFTAEIFVVQKKLSEACAIQSAFLRRSRRSVNILMNVLASSTYPYEPGISTQPY